MGRIASLCCIIGLFLAYSMPSFVNMDLEKALKKTIWTLKNGLKMTKRTLKPLNLIIKYWQTPCYGKHVYFTEIQGQVDVICFREMASYIIYEMKKKKEETESVIKAAAEIIKAELRDLDKTHTVYPTSTEISDAASNKK